MSLARVEQIFHRCLELPEAERHAFLKRECGGDEALAREVRTLLEHSEIGATLGHEAVIKRDSARGSAGGSAQGPLDDFAPGPESSPGPDPATLVGQRIGNYEVERVIASGGRGGELRLWHGETYEPLTSMRRSARGRIQRRRGRGWWATSRIRRGNPRSSGRRFCGGHCLR